MPKRRNERLYMAMIGPLKKIVSASSAVTRPGRADPANRGGRYSPCMGPPKKPRKCSVLPSYRASAPVIRHTLN